MSKTILAQPTKRKHPKASCPECGAVDSELRHALYDMWHTCNRRQANGAACGTRFYASCSPWRHGLRPLA